MFGVSIPELVIVLIIVLVALGPERLPGAARTLGKWLSVFRKSSDSVRREVYNALYAPAEDMSREFRESTRELQAFKEELIGDLMKRNPAELTCEQRERVEEHKAKQAQEEEDKETPPDDLEHTEAPKS